MATLINLRQVRKVRAREQRAEAAAEQRVRHGRTSAEKQALHARLDRERALLEGHELRPAGEARDADDGLDASVTR